MAAKAPFKPNAAQRIRAEALIEDAMSRLPPLAGAPGDHVAYVLRSVSMPDLMYCGYTCDLRRRLRQHNRLRAGGGQYTGTPGSWPWALAALIYGCGDKSAGLGVERWTKADGWPAHMRSTIPAADAVRRRMYLVEEAARRAPPDARLVWLDADMRARAAPGDA